MKTNPPLKALKTFEASARLLNFREASAELNVTASAVSHQIRLLEDYLGHALFLRHDRKVSLTTSGEYYYREVCKGLRIIDKATDTLLHQHSSTAIAISAAPIFVTRWLMPRLDSFYSAFPDIEIHIQPTSRIVNPASSEADLLIRYTNNPSAEKHLSTTELFSVNLTPVCAANLHRHWSSTGQFPPNTPLLEDTLTDGHQWHYWFDKYDDSKELQARQLIRYDSQTQLLEPTLAGHGIGLVTMELSEDSFKKGNLIPLYTDRFLNSGHKILAIYQPNSPKHQALDRLVKWMVQECEQP